MQFLYGFDLRVFVAGLTLMGEFVKVDEEEGNPNKLTGTGTYTFTSDFYAQGFWVQAAYELPLPIAPFRITPYARYEQRHGEFVGFASITVDRFTGGVNVGVGENLIVKGEYLVNREVEGAPDRRQQRHHFIGGVDMVNGRAVSAAGAALRVAAARDRAAMSAARRGSRDRWLGDDLPLPLPVKTPTGHQRSRRPPNAST